MSVERIVSKLKKIVLPLTEKMAYDLVDAEFVKERGEWYLRIYIDKAGGITIEDCERLSNELDGILDSEDFIPHAYILEVSSPGLDRPLKTDADFIRYKGELLEVFVRSGENGEGKVGEGKAGEGKAGEGKARAGIAEASKVGEGKAGEGKARAGKAREDKAGAGKSGEGKAGANKGKKGRGDNESSFIEGRLVKKEGGALYLEDEKGKVLKIDMDIVIMVKRAVRF